jgi:hypothetical protein
MSAWDTIEFRPAEVEVDNSDKRRIESDAFRDSLASSKLSVSRGTLASVPAVLGRTFQPDLASKRQVR